MSFINNQEFAASAQPAIEPSAENIGFQMLNIEQFGYILPFELVSMLLLAAMIACIVIAIKIKVPPLPAVAEKPRYHDDAEQVNEIVIDDTIMALD